MNRLMVNPAAKNMNMSIRNWHKDRLSSGQASTTRLSATCLAAKAADSAPRLIAPNSQTESPAIRGQT